LRCVYSKQSLERLGEKLKYKKNEHLIK